MVQLVPAAEAVRGSGVAAAAPAAATAAGPASAGRPPAREGGRPAARGERPGRGCRRRQVSARRDPSSPSVAVSPRCLCGSPPVSPCVFASAFPPGPAPAGPCQPPAPPLRAAPPLPPDAPPSPSVSAALAVGPASRSPGSRWSRGAGLQREPERAVEAWPWARVSALPRAAAGGWHPGPLVQRASGLEPLRGTVESSFPTRKRQGSGMPRWACERSLGLVKPCQFGGFHSEKPVGSD